MGFLNYYFKKKWIAKLQRHPYYLTLEQAINIMQSIERAQLKSFEKALKEMK